jgi:hypothetical protein
LIDARRTRLETRLEEAKGPFTVPKSTMKEGTPMAWYVSYRTGGSIVMHIFKGKELAIDAACGLLNRDHSDALEVGPMLGTRKGNLLKEPDLQRIWMTRQEQSTPESATLP